jgi:hypothetical protein
VTAFGGASHPSTVFVIGMVVTVTQFFLNLTGYRSTVSKGSYQVNNPKRTLARAFRPIFRLYTASTLQKFNLLLVVKEDVREQAFRYA